MAAKAKYHRLGAKNRCFGRGLTCGSRRITISLQTVTAGRARGEYAKALQYFHVEAGVLGEKQLRHEYKDT